VVVFPENRSLWGLASRFIRVARPDRKGRYVIAGLPASTYRVALLDEVANGQWEDPQFLESLLKRSTRVELAEGATQTVTLTLEPLR
jgi:hypothetical protein